ncbi:hypothetical protein GcM3_046017 [Golovinomyces cichoracearum]|uniref:Uncharacterized protein n=1 Tax=Golovinomyces cichoracearum TaxID=62708 RepID=A0A420J0Q8_9PEZI|nr:hypothetical protein GcM3_046017 [Golovinomyces cichoracearum]
MLEDTSTVTEADFIRFEEAFKSRFPNTTTVGEVDVHAKLAKLEQELDESLSEYLSRATALLHEFGFKGQVAGVELSAAEAGTLNSIKSKYIYGPQVRSSALLSRSLASCISIFKTAVKMLEHKKKLQEEIEVQQQLKTPELFDKQARTAGYNNLLSYAHSLDRHPSSNSIQMRPPTTNPSTNPVEQQANIGQDTSRTPQGNRREWHERSESHHSIINGSETLHPSDSLCSTSGKHHYSHPQNRPCQNPSPLQLWEQAILRRVIREARVQRVSSPQPMTGANSTPLGNRSFQRVPNQDRPSQYDQIRPQINLDEYNSGISVPSNEDSRNYQNSAFTVLPDEGLFNKIPGEGREGEKELSEKMQGIGFGFEANENSRKRTRIDCENDGDEDVQETQIMDNQADRVLGASQAGTIPGFVALDGNLEANLKKSRAERGTKELQEIYGRKGEGPMNYKKIIKGLMIGPTLSLMDLMQISPDFIRHLIKLGTRIKRRKKKPENANSGVNAAATFRPV